MPEDVTIPLEPGNYAFGERPVLRVVGTGPQTHLWIGLDNRNGSCLGVLHGKGLDTLLAIAAARKGARQAKGGSERDLGRAAEPTKSFRPDGRRRG